ncbi:hypothetical protein D9M69_625240 [compost metagenome]
MRAGHAHHQRVAVGRRLGDEVGADVPARARAVVDHHRLAPVLAHLHGDQPRRRIGGAARRERHDDADRLVRKVARLRGGDQRQADEEQRAREMAQEFHGG